MSILYSKSAVCNHCTCEYLIRKDGTTKHQCLVDTDASIPHSNIATPSIYSTDFDPEPMSKNGETVEELVMRITDNFTKILSTADIKEKYPVLYWGGNGVGDRWAKKKFNYSVIYLNKQISVYSENDDETIPETVLNDFLEKNREPQPVAEPTETAKKTAGIIGIFAHSIRTNIINRPIRKDIIDEYKKQSCVVCGTQKTICDHKNDLYNDNRVLESKTQTLDDFQPLCNHCNLQKRQVCKTEKQEEKMYSAKNIQRYKVYPFEFPWEKKAYDKNDIYCKTGTYWYDPVEFDRCIYLYSIYVIPVINEIKNKNKSK